MQAVAMFREMYRRERAGRIPGGVCYFPGSGRKYSMDATTWRLNANRFWYDEKLRGDQLQ
jgi:hypothetical protein